RRSARPGRSSPPRRRTGEKSARNIDSGGIAAWPRSRINLSIVVPERSCPTRKKGVSSVVVIGRPAPCAYHAAVRVSLADPVSYTLPYDQSLAEALARRGHEVDLLCASFTHGLLPPPDGYRRHEVFFTLSGRMLRRAPRSRLRVLVKGLEY